MSVTLGTLVTGVRVIRDARGRNVAGSAVEGSLAQWCGGGVYAIVRDQGKEFTVFAGSVKPAK